MAVRIPTTPRRMSARDAGFLYLERSHTQLHIGCVAVVEGRLRREELVARVEERLPRLHRYAQRAMHVPLSLGHPSWEDDPGFLAGHHVSRWGLPAPGGESELREAVARLLEQPLDRERPLWEMHLIEGLAGGRSAVFQKVHHCMIDGMAGAQLLEVLLDAEPAAPDRALPAPRAEATLPAAGQRVARWQSRTPRATPWTGSATPPSPRSSSPQTTWCSSPGTRRSVRGAPSPSRSCRSPACGGSAPRAAAA